MRRIYASIPLLLILTSICIGAADGIDSYVDGLNAMEAGKFKEAESAFAKAIDEDEENADFWIARGVARALSQDPQKSEAYFQRALKLQPNIEEARLWWASAAAMQGDFMRDSTIYPYAQHKRPYENRVREVTKRYGQANWELAKAKEEGEEYWDTRKSKADQAAAVKDFPELAQRFVTKVKSTNPTIAQALEARVTKKIESSDPAGSLDDLNRLLAQRPDDLKLLTMHAGVALAQGAPAVARAEYTRVLTAGDNADAFAGRACAAAMMGDVHRAQGDLAIASSLKPAAAAQYKSTVEDALKKNTVAATKADLPKMLDALRDHAAQTSKWEDLVAEAAALIRASNRERLRSDELYSVRLRELKLNCSQNPTDATALAELGEFLYRNAVDSRGERVEPRAVHQPYRPMTKQSQAREVAQAEAAVDRALALDANELKAMTFKAACLIWRLKWGDAETLLKRALAIRADDPMVLRLFAQVLDHAAGVKAAKAASLRAVDSWSDLNYIYWRYPSQAELEQADEYDQQADRMWKLAEQAMESAAAARKGTAEGFYYQGVLERRRGQGQAARASYEKAIEMNPDFLDARDELVSVCSAMGDVEAALSAQAYADNLVHTTAGPELRLTWLMIPRTKFKTARLALDAAASFDAADPRVAAYRGMLAIEREDPEGAMAWYRAAAALLEARGRMNGISASVPPMQAMLEPEDVALATAVNLRAALLLLEQNRTEEAAELFRAIAAIEPRVNRDNLYKPIAAAMLPDATMDPNRVPEADHLAYYLAWAHYGIAKSLMKQGKPAEAMAEAKRAQSYLQDKPPTADAGTRIREVTTRATILMARIALDSGDVETARNIAMAYGRPWGLPKDLEQELRQLQDDLRKRRDSDEPPPPPSNRRRGR